MVRFGERLFEIVEKAFDLSYLFGLLFEESLQCVFFFEGAFLLEDESSGFPVTRISSERFDRLADRVSQNLLGSKISGDQEEGYGNPEQSVRQP